MILRKWETIPNDIVVTENHDMPTLAYSNFFDTTHDPDGKLSSKAKIRNVSAYEYLKEIIHKRYFDTHQDFLTDGSDNFRCKLCGFKHGNGEIQAVSRFKRRYDVDHIEEIDGIYIRLPDVIDMGSSCMIDHINVTKRHTKLIKQRGIYSNQIKWLQYAWNSPEYCYIGNKWRNDNRMEMNKIAKRIQNEKLSKTDIIYILTNAFYNCRPNNMPVRLYKGIGSDDSLKQLGNVYEFINGYTRSKFNSCITHNKEYIEIPSAYLYDILRKLK